MKIVRHFSIVGVAAVLLVVVISFAQSQFNTPELINFERVAAPEYLPQEAPFFAVAQFRESVQFPVWLQLRICMSTGPCTHSSRQEVTRTSSPTLVRATRNLPAGEYQVSVLAQTRTTLGAIRTVAQADFLTHYGHQ